MSGKQSDALGKQAGGNIFGRVSVAFLALTWALVGAASGQVHDEPDATRGPIGEGKAGMVCSRAERVRPLPQIGPNGNTEGPRSLGSYDVTHYDLDIELIPEYSGSTLTAVRVVGVSTIDALAVVDALQEIVIDLRRNMDVIAITGNTSGYTRTDDEIHVTLDRAYQTGEAFQVAVEYQGYPSSGAFGAFKWWVRNGKPVIATLSEPFFARFWWPCKDQLDDKATMAMHVTVPDDLVVGSNGTLEGVDPLPNNRARYNWREDYPMITYLASLAVTNYQRYDLVYEYDDGNGTQTMPVWSYIYPDHWDFNLGQPKSGQKAGCDEMLHMLERLSTRFGQYPFVAEKYGVVETGGSGGLGANMEHQTLSSMWRVNDYSDIMLHEMAHQWWGDDVTCETWYDIWLNEGFASYSESLYREIKNGGGMNSYWSRVNSRRPSNPDAQVYRTSIGNTGQIFSGNDVYNKGSWVLHMLRHVMGSEAFFQALRSYRAAYQDDSATTAEFTATMSQDFGYDLTFFTDEWVMNPGSPDYEWNYEPRPVDGENYIVLRMDQRQDRDGFGLITMPIDVRITTNSGVEVQRVWNDGWGEYYVLATDSPATLVEIDEDGGSSNRNWILTSSKQRVRTEILAPPAILTQAVTVFGNDAPGQTRVRMALSEDIAELTGDDVSLVGANTGSHAADMVTYDPATQVAVVAFDALPDDDYTLTILSAGVSANGKNLDGEISDADWWDDQRLPSGDGQPGGDAVTTFTKQHGDANEDGLIDLTDYAGLWACLNGPDGAFDPACDVFDFNADGDVDLTDVAGFIEAYTGP